MNSIMYYVFVDFNKIIFMPQHKYLYNIYVSHNIHTHNKHQIVKWLGRNEIFKMKFIHVRRKKYLQNFKIKISSRNVVIIFLLYWEPEASKGQGNLSPICDSILL